MGSKVLKREIMELIEQIKEKARKLHKRIVLAEGSELRTLKAAEILLRENLARITLLGDIQMIKEITLREGINLSLIHI